MNPIEEGIIIMSYNQKKTSLYAVVYSKRDYPFQVLSNANIINSTYGDVICHDPKPGRDWHPHLPSYVSEPTNLNFNISI